MSLIMSEYLSKCWIPKKVHLFLLTFVFLIAVDLAIFLDIPFLRQILGFFLLTMLPGALILQILKINEIGCPDKFVLSIGLSISFVMFFGISVNYLSLSLGYEFPLSMSFFLILFNIIISLLTLILYKSDNNPMISLPDLSISEKLFLIIPILLPAISILGIFVMNETSNNIILILFLSLIIIYITSICIFNQAISDRLYPVIIYFISISIISLVALRFNHIIGDDVHSEYYVFQTTLDNLYWTVLYKDLATLGGCLSISLVPTIYHSLLDIDGEFIFKILYALIFSISPIVIYIISKKYVSSFYAFLSSVFFMTQISFINTPSLARTNTAILFVSLTIMVLLHKRLNEFTKKVFIIIFFTSCIFSHYSTTYIFFILLIIVFIGMHLIFSLILAKQDTKEYIFKRMINGSLLLLFFMLIFFWYGQVTQTTFDSGINFIYKIIKELNDFFLLESRSDVVSVAMGHDISSLLIFIKFVINWLSIVIILFGIFITLKNHQQTISISNNLENSQHRIADFLKSKMDIEYVIFSFACVVIIASTVILPYVSKGYALNRLYFMAMVALSIFFIIGCIKLSNLFRIYQPYKIILVIIILSFTSNIGLIDQVFGEPNSLILNSEGFNYDYYFIHDQDSDAAKWLRDNGKLDKTITYTDKLSDRWLLSQASITHSDDLSLYQNGSVIDGYIYLTCYNVVKNILYTYEEIDKTSYYKNKFIKKNKIFTAGGSTIYR